MHLDWSIKWKIFIIYTILFIIYIIFVGVKTNLVIMGYIVGGMGLLLQTAENQNKTRFWTVIYIKEGRGMYMIESRLLSLNTGDLLILPPTARYRFDSASLGDEYNENVIARIARFDEGWLDDLTQTFPDLSRVILNLKTLCMSRVRSG